MDSGYGITTTGFNKKTYTILMDNLEAKLKSQDLFGEGIDFTTKDPLYHFSVPLVYIASELWELAEQVHYSASPKYAEGVPLSSTGKYIGISRKQATKATDTERFSGRAGTSIPSGYPIGTETGINFVTTESKLIAASGHIDIAIQAANVGISGNVPINTITKIITPIIGLDSATNLNGGIGGQDQESDLDFRDRYEESTASGAGSTTEAIKANVLKVTGVEDCICTENDEDIEVDGVPAHSFETLVKGGDNAVIAQAIFSKKPGGIKAYGTTTINVTDSQGITYTIGFTRPTNTNIWININVTTASGYPVDGDTQIKNKVLSYINSLGLGEDVVIYKIITAISSLNLTGLADMIVTLSTDGTTYNTNNIAINTKNIAVTTTDKIEVI